MIKAGPKLRKLTVLNQHELFNCWRLGCRISYRDCGLRHAKGQALRHGEAYALVPEKWARYASPCRPCPDGAKTKAVLGLRAPRSPGPNKPPNPAYMGRRKARKEPVAPYKTCTKCPRLFRGFQASCKVCRRQAREKALAGRQTVCESAA